MSDLKIIASAVLESLRENVAALESVVENDASPDWHFPVGNMNYPTEKWYCATWHDLSGEMNGGYKHTGIDLNLDVAPWGDVERGQPVFAISDGDVHDVGYSAGWLGVVVLRIEHDRAPLWVRYAHLDMPALKPGDNVFSGATVGTIGNYAKGGDHVHFDMALEPFGWNYWRAKSIRWIDPVPVLKVHLNSALVDKMLEKHV